MAEKANSGEEPPLSGQGIAADIDDGEIQLELTRHRSSVEAATGRQPAVDLNNGMIGRHATEPGADDVRHVAAQSPVADLDPGEMAAEMTRVRPRPAAAAAAAQMAETLGPTLRDDVEASGAAHQGARDPVAASGVSASTSSDSNLSSTSGSIVSDDVSSK